MKHLIMIGLIAVAITVPITANAILPQCTVWCFDIEKNWKTKGYDPEFLKDPETIQICIDSHKDLQAAGMKDLGFCSHHLGTLP